jgi:hydrogenase small subunit
VESGHPCLGCSEPDFWDAGGFYRALSIPTADLARTAGYAAAAGIALGAASGFLGRSARQQAERKHEKVTVDELDES